MLRQVVGTGLVGLGLVGGTAAVKHNDDGSTSVKITDNGVTKTVKLGSGNGPQYSCPPGIDKTLDPMVKTTARIKLTLQEERAQYNQLDAQYPQRTVPGPILQQFNDLDRRDKELVDALNASTVQYNAALDEKCTKEE
jgi:hypothetical protein